MVVIKPDYSREGIELYCADALVALREMPDESAQCCVTSPPYWGLRDYGIDGQMGLEKSPDEYTARMVEVFREVRRVLRGDGTLWLNIGDSYASGKGTCNNPGGGSNSLEGHAKLKEASAYKLDRGNKSDLEKIGLKPKDLCGIPWRVAFALQADGWYLRSDIIWHKPNPMPESVTDRPTKAHEYLFLMSKSARYYYDAEAVKEASTFHSADWNDDGTPKRDCKVRGEFGGKNTDPGKEAFRTIAPSRNRRSVWTVATQPFSEAHFATFPPKLIEPCILAGCPEKVCAVCGEPWEREVEKGPAKEGIARGKHASAWRANLGGPQQSCNGGFGIRATSTISWQPSCSCNANTTTGTVLDPFGGAGTTGLVALQLNRKAVLVELNPTYCEMIQNRLANIVNQTDLFRQQNDA